jgi:hypothetical protein
MLGPGSVQSHVSVAEELVPPSQLPAAAELGTASTSSYCHHFQDELSFHHVIELKIPGDPVSEGRQTAATTISDWMLCGINIQSPYTVEFIWTADRRRMKAVADVKQAIRKT